MRAYVRSVSVCRVWLDCAVSYEFDVTKSVAKSVVSGTGSFVFVTDASDGTVGHFVKSKTDKIWQKLILSSPREDWQKYSSQFPLY
jgi:hypothetical protein